MSEPKYVKIVVEVSEYDWDRMQQYWVQFDGKPSIVLIEDDFPWSQENRVEAIIVDTPE